MRTEEAVSIAINYWKAVLNLVFAAFCPVCGRHIEKTGNFLCEECFKSLNDIVLKEDVAGKKFRFPLNDIYVRPLAEYEFPLTKLIPAFKYAYNPVLADRVTKILGNLTKVQIGGDFFIPVPLHPVRKRERGYNQSLIISKRLSYISGLDVKPEILKRRKYTVMQAGLQKAERLENVRGVFSIAPGYRSIIKGSHPVLVDDVCTTGATLTACAEQLYESGAAKVSAVVLGLRERELNIFKLDTD